MDKPPTDVCHDVRVYSEYYRAITAECEYLKQQSKDEIQLALYRHREAITTKICVTFIILTFICQWFAG